MQLIYIFMTYNAVQNNMEFKNNMGVGLTSELLVQVYNMSDKASSQQK